MGKAKVLELTEAQRLELERGFRMGEKHCFRMRCRAVLLKADGLSAAKAGARYCLKKVCKPIFFLSLYLEILK